MSVHGTVLLPPHTYLHQHQLLDRCVLGGWRADSLDSLCRYFRQDGPASTLFSGRHFDRFAGGGDTPAVRDQVAPTDVLALTFLSIPDRLGTFAIDVLEVHAEEIRTLLHQLPADLAMHEAPWAVYEETSPAHRLWDLLCRCGGKHLWVYANKLLARKRPHLLPIYDHSVNELLHRPASFWACLWTWFAGDRDRAAALSDLRTEAGNLDDISLLRCLDVILWMRATGRTTGGWPDLLSGSTAAQSPPMPERRRE